MNKRHFKTLIDINSQEFKRIIKKAIDYKHQDKSNNISKICKNKTLAMIFKKKFY